MQSGVVKPSRRRLFIMLVAITIDETKYTYLHKVDTVCRYEVRGIEGEKDAYWSFSGFVWILSRKALNARAIYWSQQSKPINRIRNISLHLHVPKKIICSICRTWFIRKSSTVVVHWAASSFQSHRGAIFNCYRSPPSGRIVSRRAWCHKRDCPFSQKMVGNCQFTRPNILIMRQALQHSV